MKATIKYIMFFTCCLANACTTNEYSFDTDITVAIDQTDPLTTQYPTAAAITAPLGLDENPWQGIHVVITTISDKDINQSAIVTLPQENAWMGNTTVRHARVQQFIAQLQHCLTSMKPSGTCPRSIIYRTLAAQANRLASSNAAHKYLLVYSNLYENSDMSFYNARTVDMLRTKPDRIQRQLERSIPLTDLAGVQIWLLYNPGNYDENNYYMTIAHFYSHLFEAHHAAVHIDNTFQPI